MMETHPSHPFFHSPPSSNSSSFNYIHPPGQSPKTCKSGIGCYVEGEMSSQRKITANRRNAQRSTGPKSQEGKSASSRNATRHGLASEKLTVLPGESQDDLDALIESITGEFKPATDTERHSVDRMVQARWKLARLQRWEAAAFERILDSEWGPDDPDRRFLDALGESGSILEKLQRYTTSAERAYSKALKDLLQYRAQPQNSKRRTKPNPRRTGSRRNSKNCRTNPSTSGTTPPRPARPVPDPDDTAPRL